MTCSEFDYTELRLATRVSLHARMGRNLESE